MPRPLDFRLLGPVEVRDGNRPLALGGRKQRTLLAILLLHANEVVSTDTLIDGLWGERAPKTAGTALQIYVSNLRKLLSPERLETRSPGYLLHVEPEELDLARFERLAAEAHGGDPQAAASGLGEALALWRGRPLADFAYDPFAQGEIARLEELRLAATEQRIEAELTLGRHAEVVGELEALVAEHPLRERLREQQILALYRCRRQAQALEAYRQARQVLVEELGIEPSPALRELEKAILAQDVALDAADEPLPGPKLPRGTVTFLFTDIEGSTRLLQELGRERYLEALASHRDLLREAFGRHGGVEVEMQGDSFLFAFKTAPEAAAAAASGQRALAEHSWPGEPLRVRIGLHTGAPAITENLYAGLEVHRAARIMAAAHGGQVLVSQATRELLAPEAELRDLGEHRLKDLRKPERLYQLLVEGLPSRFPPPKSLSNTNLPAPPTQLVGRKRELGELIALLRREDVRLLTLTGPPGTGKTRLALRVASELAPDYPDGVFWVPLASLRDPALVPASIAQALSIQDEAELGGGIGERRLLLLLDNFEHVAAAAPELAKLLSSCPNLNLLATSREPLHLAGEHEYVVPTLAEQEALELFRQRAHASEPEQAVLAICRRLDCLPLAVELAAARTKLLLPEALLERLQQRLPLLTGGPRDAPERQRTLEATIAWSYDLLDEGERLLFTRLTVFAGGCTLAAAEQVCEADLDTLQSLVDKNLLRREGERFQMLATIREYASEQLAQSGEEDEYERRHARHYLERACQLYDQRSFFEPHLDRRYAAHAWFLAERENLRAAFAFFTAHGDRQAQLDLGGAAEEIWTAGRVAEGRRVLAQLLEHTAGERSETRRRALMMASELASLQGDMDEGLRLAEEVLALARGAGDAYWVISGLMRVQRCAGELGELDRARAAALEGERRARELELKLIVAHFVANRANLEALRGNLAVAREVFREGLALLAESGGSHAHRAVILLNLGQIAVEEGELSEASALLDEAVDLAREQGTWYSHNIVALAVVCFASIAVGRGEAAAAARLLGAAHAWRRLDNFRLGRWQQRIHDRTLADVRAGLSNDDFTIAFTAGMNLTLDEAVEYAHSTNLVQAYRG